MSPAPPLILTLALDPASEQRFEALRRAHFPPERNLIPAHVTLFHALPGEHEERVRADLEALCRQTAPFAVRFPTLRFLGRGVAVDLTAPGLLTIREHLSARWRPWLTRQDAQTFRPHVTIQNKVTPEAARTLLGALSPGWAVPDGTGQGLRLWRYRGGPWEPVTAVGFTADAPGLLR